MTRPDISDKLIHFTRGKDMNDYETAFYRLKEIVLQKHIVGGRKTIKGNFSCVCFTEAPITSLQGGFVNSSAYSEFSPFGIIFDKKWVFEQGGRPVIYGPEEEFGLLPESMKWRYVRYEPGKIDFTWQREWRIKCNKLSISADMAAIVLPSKEWADLFMREFRLDQEMDILLYEAAAGREVVEALRETFDWKIILLDDKA